jgi:hypothetical protein
VAERPRRYGPDTVAQVEQQSRASSISSATYGSPGAGGVEAGAHQLSTIHKIIMAANAGFANRICWKA